MGLAACTIPSSKVKRRPLAITIVGWLFIHVGCVALTYHLLPQHIGEVSGGHGLSSELFWICFVRALAIAGGAGMLFGFNWGRWLLVVWMLFHLGLSVLHSFSEVVVHALLFGVILFFLFRPSSSAFFNAGAPTSPVQ